MDTQLADPASNRGVIAEQSRLGPQDTGGDQLANICVLSIQPTVKFLSGGDLVAHNVVYNRQFRKCQL